MKLKLTNYLKDLKPDDISTDQARELNPEEELLAKLAVRGWTKPTGLIADDDKETHDTLLRAIASNVQTASITRPGQWYLDNDLRIKTLFETPNADLKRLVLPDTDADSDANDPVRQAFNIWLNSPTQPLSELDMPVLKALQQIQDWTDGHKDPVISPIKVETELSTRQLNEDLARLTSYEIVGKEHLKAIDVLHLSLIHI